MIQRIQSIYLFFAAIIAIAVLFVPSIELLGEGVKYLMTGISFTTADGGSAISHPWGVAFFTSASVVLYVVAIFSFKNRQKQLRLVNSAMLFILLLYITMIVYGYAFSTHYATEFKPTPWALLPAVSYLLGWLARRAINKDEALVRAADRIR